jgi:pimeloyl-ACP methyl ester carboxylesterase
MKEVMVYSADGHRIALNHYENQQNRCLIIAPGWAMCKDTHPFVAMAEALHPTMDVIVMDFRGHGRSSGCFTFTANEPQDLAAVVHYANQHYRYVALMGFSLGAASSILHCATHADVHSLIAVSAPTAFYRIENHFWKPAAFVNTMKKFRLTEKRNVRPGRPFHPKKDPIQVVTHLNIPTLYVAGTHDPTVHEWHTRALFEATPCTKDYVVFEQGHHAEDLFLKTPDAFIQHCQTWIDASLPQASEQP